MTMRRLAVWPIGLGFAQGWLWIFFLNGPLLFAASAKWGNHPVKLFLFFIMFHSLSFLLVALAAPRLSPLRAKRLTLATGAGFMAAGTAAAGFVQGEPVSVLPSVLVISMVAAAGFGAALLVAAWGELYSALPVKQMGLSYAGAVVLGTLLLFLTSRLEFGLAMTATVLYPFLSLLFLLSAKPEPSPAYAGGSPGTKAALCPLPSRLVLLVILFYLVGGFMFKLINLGSHVGVQEMYWLTNVTYCAAALLAGMAIFSHPDLDLGFLYRPVLPLLGAGFLFFPLLYHVFAILPLAFLQTGFGLFDAYTWLLFAYLAARHRFPAKIIGWGLFFITISIFAGELLSTSIFAAMPSIVSQADAISAPAVILMLLAVVIFREKRETFAGWETTDRSLHAPEETFTAETAETATVPVRTHGTGESCRVDPVAPTAGESAVAATCTEKPPLLLSPADDAKRFLCEYGLTAREKEVLLLLLSGRNNPYIREHLNISNNTLKTHIRNIYHKLGVGNRQQLLSLFEQFRNNTGSRTAGVPSTEETH